MCLEQSLTIAYQKGVDDVNNPDGDDVESLHSDENSDDNPGDKENDDEDDINLCPRQ